MAPVFVISLPQSPKRRKITRELSSQEIDWTWVDGVLVSSLDDIPLRERSGIEGYGIPRLQSDPLYIRKAVGCKRAVINALRCAERETAHDWVIIIQDDAVICEHFKSRFTYYAQLAADDTAILLLFYGCFLGSGNPGLIQMKEHIKVRSTTAFAVRPSFAGTIREMLEKWGGEDDQIWQEVLKKGDHIAAVHPMLVTTSQKGSDIIGGIPELEELWR